ncbi:hypothetical protein [Streptomyces sp. SID12501]|nr:hypothetical protein [Streptomyces sp. SID12501]
MTINVTSTTQLDGQKLKGVVDERIELHDGAVARDVTNGRIFL